MLTLLKVIHMACSRVSKEFFIGSRKIGADSPPFIIAEAGINHEGSVDKAMQLVDAASEAGADCVKFQCHITESEMVKTNVKPEGISDESLWDIIKRCELTHAEEISLQEYCKAKGVIFLSTPFSREAADRLDSMGVPAFKIGSGECNNYPLIDHIAKKDKPVILSTGMNNLSSIRPAVNILNKYEIPFLLTHCTSMYPTPYEHVRLGALADLRDEFDCLVGLSDHSMGIYTCLGAVALGACVLEKHFTISKSWPGPDISISLDPVELRELIIGANALFAASGGNKNILNEEQPVIDFAYASVCTIKPLKKNEQFTLENVWVKRPGNGEIHAKDLESVLGKRASRAINSDELISLKDLL